MTHDELREVRKIVEWAADELYGLSLTHRYCDDSCHARDYLRYLDAEVKKALEIIDQALLEE